MNKTKRKLNPVHDMKRSSQIDTASNPRIYTLQPFRRLAEPSIVSAERAAAHSPLPKTQPLHRTEQPLPAPGFELPPGATFEPNPQGRVYPSNAKGKHVT